MQFSRAGSALLVLTGLVSSAAALEVNTNNQINLEPGACTAFEVDNLPHKFSYDVELVGLTGICINSNISISKLYVQDACINKRDNELAVGSVQVPICEAVHDTSASTCESVFANGPADALLTAGNLTAGQSFDSGNACASGSSAFVFVKNSCQLPSMATVNVKTRDYDGKLCLTVAGHALSSVAIGIIVVVVILVVIALLSIVACCCCRGCCCR